MDLIVGPADYRDDLTAEARTAWNAFVDEIGTLPFAYDHIRFDSNARSVSGIAGAFFYTGPRHPREFALILFSPSFFEKEPHERTLTLLHESIHLRFMLGPMRNRVIGSLELDQIYQVPDVTDPDDQQFLRQRRQLSFDFRSFIDEILAELYLKVAYPDYFRDRLAYYLAMRRRSLTLWQRGWPSLRPSALLYEIVRNELGVQLAQNEPEATEFGEMSAGLQQELERLCSPAEYARHRAMNERLTWATLEPIAYDDAAFCEAFMTTIAIPRNPPEPV